MVCGVYSQIYNLQTNCTPYNNTPYIHTLQHTLHTLQQIYNLYLVINHYKGQKSGLSHIFCCRRRHDWFCYLNRRSAVGSK